MPAEIIFFTFFAVPVVFDNQRNVCNYNLCQNNCTLVLIISLYVTYLQQNFVDYFPSFQKRLAIASKSQSI